jgi:hypothetical protein
VVEFGKGEVRFLSPSGDSIKRYLTTGRIPLAFTEVQNGDLVVGGSTEDLWRQLGRFLAHPGTVDSLGSTILRRLPPH